MSLDDVEVTIDDELITIEESTDNIDIYLRAGIHESRRTEVAYELMKHFEETIGFDEKFTALINLLMVAPINRLPRILDKHNVPLPEDSHAFSNVGSREETPDPENDKALTEECNVHLNGSDGSHDSGADDFSSMEDSSGSAIEFTRTESVTGTDAEQRGRPSSIARTACRNHAASLREMIPWHQIRSESIIRRAKGFRPSDAEAASPIQHHSESRAAPLLPPLPTMTGITGNSADGMSEIRAREIGYLGELFVNNPTPGKHRSHS